MKNIVLLGGSNSVMVNGLQKGLREYANVTNLALGATTNIQNSYELYRERNQEAIKNADLIVTESNINDIDQHAANNCNLPLNLIFKNLQYLYATLYSLNRPICILLLPFFFKNHQTINNMHRFLANYYRLNIIDVQSYCNFNEITDFAHKFTHHQLNVVNRNLGKAIAKNLHSFKVSNKNLDINLPEFKILTPENMSRNGNFKIFNAKNSAFNEIIYRLDNQNSLSFNGYEDYQILSIHSWNLGLNGEFSYGNEKYSSICLQNDKFNIVKPSSSYNQNYEIQAEPVITSNTIATFNKEALPYTELHMFAWYDRHNSISLPYFDLIAFFLCKPNPNMKLFDLSVIPTDKDVEIDKDIDRSYLIPNIVFFKDSMEFIDEYIGHLYPNIVKHIDSVLTPQIIKKTEAQILSQLNKNTPQAQPSIQLSLEAENQILKDKIKELETNYQKALNTKNHLSYKLGEALIKANKNWYKGGYVKFIFEAMRIKKEHNKK